MENSGGPWAGKCLWDKDLVDTPLEFLTGQSGKMRLNTGQNEGKMRAE
jgi:hypothetical protein